MAQIKLNATYGMTGTLPAVSGANLTTLNGTQVTSGTLPMARLSGTLPALNGSALTTLNASNVSSGTLNAARYSGGKILQVVSTVGTYVTDTSSTSPSTNIYVTIVCSASSSKVLVIYAPPSVIYFSNTSNFGHHALYREVSGGADTNLTTSGHGSNWGIMRPGSSGNMDSGSNITYLDSPNTTTSLDYKIKVRTDNTALNMIYGHSSGQPCMSSITVMEIGA